MAERGMSASGATENFNPKQPVTKAQAATILNHICLTVRALLRRNTLHLKLKLNICKEDAKK